jgi:hypothetical protein
MSETIKRPACYHPDSRSDFHCSGCGAAIPKDETGSREVRLKALENWAGLYGLVVAQEAAESYWFLARADHPHLARLLETRPASDDPVRRLLEAKLDRGLVCDADQLPRDIVRLGTHIDLGFRDGLEHCVLADPDGCRHPGGVSILSPLGALLLGMPEGRSLRAQSPDGASFSLVVGKVCQPEPLHRPAANDAGQRRLAS